MNTKRKPRLSSRAWALLLAGTVCACLLYAFRPRPARPEQIAGIYVDGVCVRRVDLNRVTEEERYIVEGYEGENVVLIQPGRIRVESADCPDQICVSQGWLPNPDFDFPIICLPHHMHIQMEGDSP